jgi:hypothetical protein
LVCSALRKAGWNIERFADTSQSGVDVVASRGKHGLYIEAKGVTSSKELSTRFGKVQNSSQIFIQTATALLRCAELRSGNTDADVCIAIPDHDSFRKRIERIEMVLKASRIGVLWVAADSSVTGWNTTCLCAT